MQDIVIENESILNRGPFNIDVTWFSGQNCFCILLFWIRV